MWVMSFMNDPLLIFFKHLGEHKNLPRAQDMYAMEWNDETLAVRAKKWLETCRPTEEAKSDREHQIYGFIGQNLFHKLGMETVRNSTMSHEIVIKKIMNDWFYR